MLKNICFMLIAALLISTHSFASEKPNIFIIMVDDLDTVVTEPYYDEVLPFTMSLKKDGAYFKNAFISTPTCCPSRASTLTGMYSHNTEVYGNRGPHGEWKRFGDRESDTMATRLYDLGYSTYIAGKYLNGYMLVKNNEENQAKFPNWEIYNESSGNQDYLAPPLPPGWEAGNVWGSLQKLKNYTGYNYETIQWTNGEPTEGNKWTGQRLAKTYGDDESDYSTDVLFNEALEHFSSIPNEKPIFAYLSPSCPHSPLPPAPRHVEKTKQRWGGKTFPKDRPNYYNKKAAKKKSSWITGSWFKRKAIQKLGGFGIDLAAKTPGQGPFVGFHKRDWFNRMGSMYACDEGVQNIVEWLKENGRWDNTLLIFMSDNGYMHGAHGLSAKTVPYEEAIRVPLMVVGGENIKIQKGVTVDQWALNIDLFPTLLDFVGESIPEKVDGLSLKPMLVDNSQPTREEFLMEYMGLGFSDEKTRRRVNLTIDIPRYFAVKKKIQVNGEQHDFMYVTWQIFEKGPEVKEVWQDEIYDTTADPYQLTNLMADDSWIRQNPVIVDLLKSTTDRLKVCSGPSCK